MLELYGLEIPTELDEISHPRRTALIVYDMQVGVVSQIPGGDAIVRKVSTLLAAARSRGYRVFFTRHTYLPAQAMGVAQLRRAMIWHQLTAPESFRPPFALGSPEWQIVPELAPMANEAIVDKITMSAFCGTYLDVAMRDANLDVFVIAGIALEIGIEPTVRHACDLNYIPIVPQDACGFRDLQARQRALDGFAFSGEPIVTDTGVLEKVMLNHGNRA
jgi:biuret amidohydrolase